MTPAEIIDGSSVPSQSSQQVRALNVVDALLVQAQSAGATVTDQPHDRPWGIYSGYFRDPDGHLWEVMYREPQN